MEKKWKHQLKEWIGNLDLRKLSFRGKILVIISFLLVGLVITINFIHNFTGKLPKYSTYSIWVLFGWFFLIIITYISVKLLSFTVLKNKQQKIKEELSGEDTND